MANNKNACNHYTKSGKKCKNPAGFRTSHTGEGPCYIHDDSIDLVELYNNIDYKTPTGRPEKEPNNSDCILVEHLARDGYSNDAIREELGISKDLFYRWKNECSEFSGALYRGRTSVNEGLELNAFRRAIGYDYQEEAIKYDKSGRIVGKTVIKRHQPADTRMNQFLLKNYMPDKYKDKKELEGNMTFKKLEDFLVEELEDDE
jgi:hypothetical protein